MFLGRNLKKCTSHWKSRGDDRRLAFENLENRILLTNNSGPALQLDGVNDYATASDSASLDLGIGANDDLTVEVSFFVPADLSGNRQHTLLYKDQAYALYCTLNALGSDTITFRTWDAPNSNFTFQSVLPINAGWHHVAAVFDNEFTSSTDLWDLFLDGSRLQSNQPFDIAGVNNSASSLNVGANNLGSNALYGFIDEVRLSNIVRYSGATYGVPTTPFASDGNTRALWHFDESVTSTTFFDASPNANTLTGLNGAQTGNPPVNDNYPVITSNGGGSTASVNVAENTTAVTTVTATDADLPAQTLSYSISGGADAAKFTIGSSSGVLTFISAPNYEAPTDAGANNVYDVTVQVSDGALTDTQAIAVTVTPINDNSPVITSNGGGSTASVNVAENTTAVTTVTSTDADLPAQTRTYSISGGADAAKFTIGSSTGVLTFVSAPNYEAPTDAGANNVYDVTVQVSDGALTDTQAIAVTVTDINDGDYDLDNSVDAADFVMWRKAEGSSVPPFSGADGSGNGIVDEADYGIWRANFGNSLPPPGSGSAATLTVTAAEPVPPKATTEAVASEQATLATEVTGTRKPISPLASSVVQAGTPRSGRSRLLRSGLPLVAASHDDALVAWLATRRERPQHHESADFADFRSEQVTGDALGQLDNALDVVFASLGE